MANGDVPVLRSSTRLTRVGVLPRPSPAGWRAVARLRDAFDETLPTLKLAPVGRRPRREPPVLQLVVPAPAAEPSSAGVPTPVHFDVTCELSGAAIEVMAEPAAAVDFGDPSQPLDPEGFASPEPIAPAAIEPPAWSVAAPAHTAPLSFVHATAAPEPGPAIAVPQPIATDGSASRSRVRPRTSATWWLALGLVAVLSLALGSSLARQTLVTPAVAPAGVAAPSMIVLPSPIIVTTAHEPVAAPPSPIAQRDAAAIVSTPPVAIVPAAATPPVAIATPPVAIAPRACAASRPARRPKPRAAVSRDDDDDEDETEADAQDDAEAPDAAPVIATPSPAERALHDAERAFADGRHAAALVFARQALASGAGPRAARIMALSGCVAGDADAVRRALAALPAGQHGSVRARCREHDTALP
ncbi:MAG: hypothetical protein K1X88_15545 [Nannocystaceae bacterium]|nr:hypothetical protein [Nannocystaceae bacterium]